MLLTRGLLVRLTFLVYDLRLAKENIYVCNAIDDKNDKSTEWMFLFMIYDGFQSLFNQ